jgi:ribosomal protein L29
VRVRLSSSAGASSLTLPVLFDLFRRTKNDLTKQLAELKKDLLTLRVQKIAGGSAAKLTKMFVSLPLTHLAWNGADADRLPAFLTLQ